MVWFAHDHMIKTNEFKDAKLTELLYNVKATDLQKNLDLHLTISLILQLNMLMEEIYGDNKPLLTKSIKVQEDDLPIVYIAPDKLYEIANTKLNVPKAIITTEEDFNRNGFIFESDIKIEGTIVQYQDVKYPNIHFPGKRSECSNLHGYCTVSTQLEENLQELSYKDDNNKILCRRKVVVKVRKLSSEIIKKYSEKVNIQQSTSTNLMFKCDICGQQTTAKDNLKYHMKIHIGGKKHACDYCPKKFLVSYQLKVHRRIHTDEKPYECTECNKKFSVLGTLIEHRRIHSDERPYLCDYENCSKKFKKSSSLYRHKRRHTGEKPFACKYCSKTFFSNHRLKIHSRIHTGEKPYSCNFCPSKFTEKCVLDNHRRIHTGEKPYACSDCPSKFSRLSTLIDHRRTHIRERLHACANCRKKFNSKQLLRVHEQVLNEKKYSCDHCSVKFRIKKSLDSHRRIGTDKEQFKCRYCGETSAWRCDLKKHMETHLGQKLFECNVCSKRFTANNLLNKHKRIHIDEQQRRYACSDCPKKFYNKAMLNRHILTHTGEKPLKFKDCLKRFARPDSLNSHMQRIHLVNADKTKQKKREQTPREYECYSLRLLENT